MSAHVCGRATRAGPRVIDALRRFAPDFAGTHSMIPEVYRTLRQVLRCRTSAMGGHRFRCGCGFELNLYNSCRNRHCPQCGGARRRQWLERQLELLPQVGLFHTVFTLPGALRTIARQHPRIVYDCLFDAAQHTLQTLARDRWDARIGIIAVLHTWKRNMLFHPHVHCLIPAGGLTEDGQWVHHADFLFPHRVMQNLFRGRLLETLHHRLRPHLDPQALRAFRRIRRRTYAKPVVIFVDPPNGRDASHLVAYLAHYVQQIAISDRRIVDIGANTVTIATRGSATCTMPGVEFFRRFALHILPRRYHRIRHFGLLASGARKRLAKAHAALGSQPPQPAPTSPAMPLIPASQNPDTLTFGPPCPRCGRPTIITLIDPRWTDPFARGPP